ncbi:MAG: hypothetical protein AB2689_06385, partial [Candidatus Thiodiazotropha taylori]
ERLGWNTSWLLDYHRNTEAEKASRSLVTGASFSHFYTLKEADNPDEKFVVDLNPSLVYKRDFEKSTKSVMARINIIPIYGSWFMHRRQALPGLFDLQHFDWEPFGALEYERRIDGDSTKDGQTSRAIVGGVFNLYPFYDQFKNPTSDKTPDDLTPGLVLSYSDSFWHELSHSGVFDDEDDSARLRELSLTWFPNVNVGLSLKWLKGENPSLGKEFQNYVGAGLEVRYDN